MKKVRSIQHLRAFAALGVVLFHATERVGAHHFVIGAAGVDVFFVISGFIMWVISRRRPTTPRAFMTERVLRIAPTYWLATGVMVAGGLLGLFPNLVLSVPHVLASLFFLPAHSPSNGHVWPVLVQGWTLNYEMFFYAVFALALGLPSRVRLAFMGAVFIALVAMRHLFGAEPFLLHFYGRPILLEFLAGALIGKAWLDGGHPGAIVSTALVALGFSGFCAVAAGIAPYDMRVLAPCACLLVYGASGIDAGGLGGVGRALTYLGDGSYSIYLWHTLAISVVARGAGLLDIPPAMAVLICLAGGTIGGLVAYEAFERPVSERLKDRAGAARPNEQRSEAQGAG